ncbi:MAG: M4 family metallopeptidase [Gammaproteobacteria bacterium]|nr:M4 family metallopeptidase [Gammaproteobacteria bacterium]
MKNQLLKFIFLLIVAASAQAVDRAPATLDMVRGQSLDMSDVDATLEVLEVVRSRTLANGKTVSRLRQTYQGIPVWGQAATRSSQGLSEQIHGEVVTGLSLELPSVQSMIKVENAIERAMIRSADLRAEKNPIISTLSVLELKLMARNTRHQPYIYIDKQNKAHLSYLINWVEYSKQPSRPFYFIDALNDEVLEHWEGINKYKEATGPGGNEITGKYFYGVDLPPLQVDENCRMDTGDVETINMNHKYEGGEVFQFICPNNNYKAINGAYSPLNDTHFFGNVVLNMYKDWYGEGPLNHKLQLRVHYGEDVIGAGWDGTYTFFGDGGVLVYPLVNLDVIGHEIGHGFSEQNSQITSNPISQTAAINESFSDMSGESAEFYLRGSNNWIMHEETQKDNIYGTEVRRYFEDPTLDGRSPGHASDYNVDLGAHYNCGVFNRAFFLIATSSGWDTRKAFDIFVLANQMYWSSETDFLDGACDALLAANDLGYDTEVVVDAFDTVGIYTANCSNLETDNK